MTTTRRKRRGNELRAVSVRAALGAGLAGGVVAVIGGPRPTGVVAWDVLLVIGTVTAAAWASATAPWWALILTPGCLALAAPTWWGVPLAAALAGAAAVIGVRRVSWGWARGAIIATVAAAGAHAGNRWAFGATSLLVAGAVTVAAVAGVRRRPSFVRRRAWLALGAVGGMAGAAVLVAVLGMLSARGDLREGERLGRLGLAQAQRGDTDAARASLRDAADAFGRAHDTLGAAWMLPGRAVPVLAQHQRALTDLSAAAGPAIGDASDALAEVDTSRLEMVDGAFDLDGIRALDGPFARLSTAVRSLAASTDAIDRGWLVGPLQTRLDGVGEELARNQRLLDNAEDAVRLAPDLLGATATRHYFVAFMTPAESRGLGGFMGNWAEITVAGGRIEMTAFGTDEDLNRGGAEPDGRVLTGPAEFVDHYGQFGFVQADGTTSLVPWKNITMPADFPTVAGAIAGLYPQSGGRELDGVFAVDIAGIAALMKLTGPVRVDGLNRPLNANTVEDFLLKDQYLLERDERADMLDAIARTVVDALLTTTLPEPTQLARTLGPLVPARHLMAWSPRSDEQALFTALGMDGAVSTWLAAGSGDHGVAVARNNAAANKLDVYVPMEVTDDATGATIRLENTADIAALPDYVDGNPLGLPEGTARTRFTVYTLTPVAGFTRDGAVLPVSSGQEAGAFAYTFVLDLAPGEATTIRLEWAL